jgi:hypothetical protein
MKKYTITFTDPEMEFFRQLFSSQLPVTINTVEVVALVKSKITGAKPDLETLPGDESRTGT